MNHVCFIDQQFVEPGNVHEVDSNDKATITDLVDDDIEVSYYAAPHDDGADTGSNICDEDDRSVAIDADDVQDVHELDVDGCEQHRTENSGITPPMTFLR